MTSMTHPSSRHGTVTRDGGHGTISFDRRLPHPVDRVWEALTTPDGLAGWWLPFDATITVDLSEGGAISFAAPELGAEPMRCEIVEVDPPRLLVYRHFSPGTTLSWELSADGDGCRLRLTEDTPDIAAALGEGHIVGLHHSLDRLEPKLDGAPEPWDWDRLPVIEAEYARVLDAS
ncbi:MAG TPA: SRPBCC family protein [Nocardioides sp.]|nr:SRPBCC family protein [Nocardioides sp.]